MRAFADRSASVAVGIVTVLATLLKGWLAGSCRLEAERLWAIMYSTETLMMIQGYGS